VSARAKVVLPALEDEQLDDHTFAPANAPKSGTRFLLTGAITSPTCWRHAHDAGPRKLESLQGGDALPDDRRSISARVLLGLGVTQLDDEIRWKRRAE